MRPCLPALPPLSARSPGTRSGRARHRDTGRVEGLCTAPQSPESACQAAPRPEGITSLKSQTGLRRANVLLGALCAAAWGWPDACLLGNVSTSVPKSSNIFPSNLAVGSRASESVPQSVSLWTTAARHAQKTIIFSRKSRERSLSVSPADRGFGDLIFSSERAPSECSPDASGRNKDCV